MLWSGVCYPNNTLALLCWEVRCFGLVSGALYIKSWFLNSVIRTFLKSRYFSVKDGVYNIANPYLLRVGGFYGPYCLRAQLEGNMDHITL